MVRAVALALAVLLTACAATPEPARPIGLGEFTIMEPAPDFDPADPPPSWAVSDPRAFAVAEQDGAPALRIATSEAPVVAGRWLSVRPLAHPFLRWGWTAEGMARPAVYIGFRLEGRPRRTLPPPWNDPAVPAVARGIEVVWPRAGARPRVWHDSERRVARLNGTDAGRAVGRWRLETLDLPGLYRQIWPADDLAAVELVFVGFGGEGDGAGYAAEAVLFP